MTKPEFFEKPEAFKIIDAKLNEIDVRISELEDQRCPVGLK